MQVSGMLPVNNANMKKAGGKKSGGKGGKKGC